MSLGSVWDMVEENGAFQKGWDGNGATAVSSTSCGHAQCFLTTLMDGSPRCTDPVLSLHPNGTIALAWCTGFVQIYVEIGNTTYSCYVLSRIQRPDGLYDVKLYDGTIQDLHAIIPTVIRTALTLSNGWVPAHTPDDSSFPP